MFLNPKKKKFINPVIGKYTKKIDIFMFTAIILTKINAFPFTFKPFFQINIK